jgi:hypothetical protein
LTYFAQVIKEEHGVPLWDDSVAGGRPLAGDPGILWLYPFDLLFLLLSPALAFNWLAVIHTSISGIGSYLFLKRGLNISQRAAILGAIAYMLSPKFISHLAGGHVGLTYGAAWIPWALWGTRQAMRGNWKGTGLASLSLALQMPTHIQIPFYTAWLMALYAAWHLVLSKRFAKVKFLVSTAAIVPSFIALSAPILFPLIGLLPYTSRQGFTLQDASWYSLPPILLFTFLSPAELQFPEWTLYPGAIALILAFLALLGHHRKETLFWWGIVLFALLYAVGPALPIFPATRYVPGFAQLRVPPRIWFIGCFGMSVLTALGADSLLYQETWNRIRRLKKWLIRFSILVYGGEAAAILGNIFLRSVPWHLTITFGVSSLAIGLLIAYTRKKLRKRHLLASFLLLLILELASLAYWYTLPIPVKNLLAETPALRFLQRQSGTWRVYSTKAELPYARAAQEGIEAAEGLLALQVNHYVDFVKQASGCHLKVYGTGVPPCLTGEGGTVSSEYPQPDPKLMGLLNVRYVLTSDSIHNPDLELVKDFGEERIYENKRLLPRAFVVFQVETLPSQEIVLKELPQIDPTRVALLTDPVPLPSTSPSHDMISARIIKQTANATEFQTAIDQSGMLIISRTWMPGWKAWVDGKPTQVYRVNYAFQGIVLSPGEHTIYLRYHPIGFAWGWVISVTTVGVFALLLILSWLISRRT